MNEAEIRSWFSGGGWELPADELSRELNDRGCDPDLAVDLLDEAADRHRARDEKAAAGEVPAAVLVEPGEYVLSALLYAGALGADISNTTLDRVRATGLAAPMFPREHQRLIFGAMERVVDSGGASEFLAVEAELTRTGELDRAGGQPRIRALIDAAATTQNADHYARLVVREHRRYEEQRLAGEMLQAAQNGGLSAALRDELIRILEPPLELADSPEARTGGAFIFDQPTDVDAIRVWGDGDAIGWASGEGLMLLGPDGVGKTTLGQQLALARAGLRTDVLGMHVTPTGSRVLYIAADRPRQAARSLRRMVSETERDQLDDALTVWGGPLPAMLNEDRTILTRLARQFGADTICIDSLKDVAVDVATDESGGRIATCFQHAIASGIELLVLHHPRKPGVDNHRKPKDLSDAYGSRLIYGVMGSVMMLWGEPGDVLVELRHLKQPIDELGPWNIVHDHQRGRTTVEHGTDLLDVVLASGTAGITADDAATVVYRKETPTRAEVARIRSRLDRLAGTDKLVKLPSAADGRVRYLYNGPAEVLR